LASYKHEYGAILTFSTPEHGRVSAIVCPIRLIRNEFVLIPEICNGFSAYVYSPPERRYRCAYNWVLVDSDDFLVLEDAEHLGLDSRELFVRVMLGFAVASGITTLTSVLYWMPSVSTLNNGRDKLNDQ